MKITWFQWILIAIAVCILIRFIFYAYNGRPEIKITRERSPSPRFPSAEYVIQIFDVPITENWTKEDVPKKYEKQRLLDLHYHDFNSFMHGLKSLLKTQPGNRVVLTRVTTKKGDNTLTVTHRVSDKVSAIAAAKLLST